jgi:hypothetical protein
MAGASSCCRTLFTSRIVSLIEPKEDEGDAVTLEGGERLWISINPPG